MPGYTHMQKAMPSSLGMWAMSYAASLVDDLVCRRTAGLEIRRRLERSKGKETRDEETLRLEKIWEKVNLVVRKEI